jgi:predicted dehydrogenase
VHCEDAVLVLHGTATDAIDIHRADPDMPGQPRSSTQGISARPALLRELETFLEYLQGGPPPRSGMKDALEITRTVTDLRRMAGLDE